MSTENSLTTSIPWRSSTVQVVLLTTFISPFSIALISPGLPVFRDTFSLTDPAASLLLSTIVIPGIFLSPLIGLLTDRLGRRRAMGATGAREALMLHTRERGLRVAFEAIEQFPSST